jgi:hypothetical protein
MKKLILFCVIISTFIFGCKTQQQSAGYTYDDVYSTKADHPKIAPKPAIHNEDLTGAQTLVTSDSSSTLKSTSAKSNPDLSSDNYAARIKRFNDKNPGLNYNSEYYTTITDSTAAATGGSSPSVNLFLGSSWGSPFYGPSLSFGFGYGGYYGYGYPYYWDDPFFWGYPYYYYPSYYGYGYGYGYGCGYCYGNDYYGYGGYGHHRDYYYGQRRALTPTDGGRNPRTTTGTTSGGTQPNARTTTSTAVDQARTGRAVSTVPPDKQHYSYTRSVRTPNPNVVRPNPNSRSTVNQSNVQRQAPSPRYTRPGVQQQVNRTQAQTYSSPAYRQPKSSREYINPRTQQGRTGGVSDNSNRTVNSNPGSSRRYFPSGNGSNSRIYSNPSGGSRGYSSPSRSSGSGYSSPSRSGSYSGGGNSGGRSGGGNSGGGGGGSSSGGGGGGGRHR